MRKILYLAVLSAALASAQTAVFPGAVATDSQLLVGANLCTSRLAQAVADTTSTTLLVTNSNVTSTCFLVNEEVQIDNEFLKITAVAFGQLTVTRAFDNSVASTHQANAPVTVVNGAWLHNADKAEIEAIEGWLKNGGSPAGVTGITPGDIIYYNGTLWTLLPGNNTGTNCFQENAAGVPAWANCGAGGGINTPTFTGPAKAISGSNNLVLATAADYPFLQPQIVFSVKAPPYNAQGTSVVVYGQTTPGSAIITGINSLSMPLLAVGQAVAGQGLAGTQASPVSNTITAVGTNQITISTPAVAQSTTRFNMFIGTASMFSFPGTATSGSATITNIPSTTGLAAGQIIYAPGILPANTTVVTVAANSITLSANAVNSSISPLTAGPDDTTAFSSACTDALAVHGLLFLPTGNYLTNINCLTGIGAMTFEGANPEGTILTSRNGGDVFHIPTPANPVSLAIKNMKLIAYGAGSIGINTTGAFPYMMNVEKVTINGDGQCMLMPTEFSIIINGNTCQSWSTNGIEVAGDNTTIIENNYVQTVGQNSFGYVVYAGATTMLNNNGINGTSGQGASWGVIGTSMTDGDPQNSYAQVNFYGNNFEDFMKYAVWIKGGSTANFYGNRFFAYANTLTEAIRLDQGSTYPMILDPATSFSTQSTCQGTTPGICTTPTGGNGWVNGFAIHGVASCTLFLDMTGSVSATGSNCYNEAVAGGTPYRNASFRAITGGFGILALDIPYLSASGGFYTPKINNMGTITPSGNSTALIGGPGALDFLSLQGTSGNGSATFASIKLLGGNNGATPLMTLLNNGNVGLGLCTASTVQFCHQSTAATEGGLLGTELTAVTDTFTFGADWAGDYSPDGFTHTPGSATNLVDTTPAIVANNLYQIQFTLSSWTAGSVTVAVGTSVSQTYGANGTYTFSVKPNSTAQLTWTPTSSFAGIVGSISMKQITPYLPIERYLDHSSVAQTEIRNSAGAASGNTFFGLLAGEYNTSGINNTFFGSSAGVSNTTGSGNVAVGTTALLANTIAANNVAVGQAALGSNWSSSGNVAIGYSALQFLQSGTGSNTAIGANALNQATTASGNLAVGINALFGMTTGFNNAAIGYQACRYQADGVTANTASNLTLCIGYSTRLALATDTNEGVFGTNAIGNGSNTNTFGSPTTVANIEFGIPLIPINAAAVASAATIAIPAGKPIFHVSGTTTINNITAPTACIGANQQPANGLACQIEIIPDNLWLTGVTGNIALATTAVVSKTLTMTYDPNLSKWFPSY